MIKIKNLQKTVIRNVLLNIFLIALFFLYGNIKQGNNLLDDISFSRAFYDRDKNLLRLTLSEDDKYRHYTPTNNIPAEFIEALLLKEDKHFYYHPGVNPAALVRAFIQTYIDGSLRIGASTITMQTARLYYKLHTKNITGKLKQIAAALFLELFFSKENILSAYINLAPCGRNVEGFPGAALLYFGRSLAELSFSEMLLLAVIPQNPAGRTPAAEQENNELLKARLLLFQQWAAIHPGSESLLRSMEVFPEIQKKLPFRTPHLIDSLIKRKVKGISVYTTIEQEIQTLVERHTNLYLKRLQNFGVNNAAVQILDYNTMELLASLGSADFFDNNIQGQVNGTESYRSPGSTLKPFIYARALDMGLIHPKTMLKDAPTSFGEYSPDNFLKDFKGPVHADHALVSSRNIPAIFLGSKIEEPDLYDMLARIGVPLKPKEHYGLSIVLGSAEVRMKDLLVLYAALANNGAVFPVKEILDTRDGPPITRLFSPEAGFLILNILKDNPVPGESLRQFSLNRDEPVAYKTGTSIGFKDCWSVGVFDNLVIAVWLGNFNGYGNHAFIGRRTAVPLMFEIIDSLRRNAFSEYTPALYSPGGRKVTQISVCSVSGGIKGKHCPHTVKTLFIPGKSPIESCRIHRSIHIDPGNGFQCDPGTPGAVTEVWEVWPTDLLTLFREAGLPRKQPPPFAPGSGLDHMTAAGYAPKITSPLGNTEYIFRLSETGRREIPLEAVADGDVKTLYWFVDNSYIGSATPSESPGWFPQAGEYIVRVVDERGRQDSRNVRVSTER